MGVMKKAHVVARVSPSAIDDEWQRRATAAAIRAARGLVRDGSHIPSGTPVAIILPSLPVMGARLLFTACAPASLVVAACFAAPVGRIVVGAR